MKKTNLIKSILMVSCCVFFMAGCQNNAVADDGTDIRDYSKIDTGSDDSGSGGGAGGETSQKFWKEYAPFVGIQVWTKGADGSVWGQEPVINMDEGTISAISASPAVMFPVFGAFDEAGEKKIGTYDCSKIRKIEFEIKANVAGSDMTFASYVSGSEVKQTKEKLTTEFVKKSYDVQGSSSADILFYFNLDVPNASYVVTVNNVAFYDGAGNQITDIQFTSNQ